MITHALSFRTSVPFAFVCALLLGLLVALAAVQQVNHADAKHGVDAEIARGCKSKWDFVWYNPTTQRTAYTCFTPAGLFGVYIEDADGVEVTAFLKEKIKDLVRLQRYMENRGYLLIKAK